MNTEISDDVRRSYPYRLGYLQSAAAMTLIHLQQAVEDLPNRDSESIRYAIERLEVGLRESRYPETS